MIGVLPPEARSLVEYPLEGHWKPKHWARCIKGGFPINENGAIKIPDAPGLGVEIDWDVIQTFGKRSYQGTTASVGIHTLMDRGLRQTKSLRGRKMAQMKRSQNAEFAIPSPPF